MTNPDLLYLTDNGACLCGQHLGITARMTGRDLSGQRIMAIHPDHHTIGAVPFKCETCGATLGRSVRRGVLRAVLVRRNGKSNTTVTDYPTA